MSYPPTYPGAYPGPGVVNTWTGWFTTAPGFGYSQPFGAHIQVPVANSDGNWLIAVAAWQSPPGFATTMSFGDDAGNAWHPLGAPVGTSSPAGNVRAAIWAAPNAAPASVVWASPSGYSPAYAVTILEVQGMGPGLSLQAVNTAYANAGTSLAAALPAPAVASLAVAVMGSDQPGSLSSGPGAGWASLPPVIATPAPLAGAFLSAGALGQAGYAGALAAWSSLTSLPVPVTRWYKAAGDFGYDSTLQAMVAAGARVCLSLRPAYNPVSSSDLASIGTLLSTLNAAGADVEVTLWHEPSFNGLTAAQYTAMIQYYSATVRQYYPLWCVLSGTTDTVEANGYFPGSAYVDGIAVDAYAFSGFTQVTNAQAMADNHGLSFGIWEWNGSNHPGGGDSQSTVTSFAGQLQSLMAARLTAGKPCGSVIFFSSGPASYLGTGLSQEGGFEGAGTGTWAGAGGSTIAQSAAQAHSGSDSLAITATGTGNARAGMCATTPAAVIASGMPVAAGNLVGAGAWFRAATAARSCQVQVAWYDATGTTLISTSSSATVTDSTSGWTQATGSFTAPATAAYAVLQVQVVTPGGAGEVHYADDPQMLVYPSVNDLTTPVQYSWDYRIGLVASMQSALQSPQPGLMLRPAWQVTSGAAAASWTAAQAADMAACAVAVAITQAATAGPSQGWPHVTFEAAFGAGINTPWDQLTWTDLTPRYKGISGQRGKQYELDSVQASSMNLTLSNNDGALTPGYASSPYYLGLADWSARNNVTLGLSRAWAWTGPQAMLMAPDGVTAGPYAESGQYPAGTAGWSGSAAVLSPQGWASGAHVEVNWYNSSHAYLSSTVGSAVALTAGQWAYPSVTAGSPPGGAAYATLALHVNGTPPAGTLLYWDACYLVNPAGQVANANPVFAAGPDVFVPVRKTATWLGRAYRQFRGFMERWPQALSSSRYTNANCTATDIYAGLTALLPASAQGEILNDEPWGYWPCTDAQGSTAAANLAPTGTGALQVVTSKYGAGATGAQAFGGSAAFAGAAAGQWVQSGLNAGSVDQQHGFCLQLQSTTTPSIASGLTIECWAMLTGASPNGQLILWALQGSSGTIAKLWADYDGSGGGQGFYLSVTDKVTRAVTTTILYGPVTPAGYQIHFGVTLTQSGWSVTIDGGGITPAHSSGSCNLAPSWQWITWGGSADRVSTGGSSNISLAGLAVYPRVLPASRILAHYGAAVDGQSGDGEGSRMTRLLGYAGMLVPRRLGLGPDAVGPATDIQGQSCAQNVTNIAQSGAGLLYADRCGYLAYQPRDQRWNKPVAQAVGEQAGAILNVNWDFESGTAPWQGHNGAGGTSGVTLAQSSAAAWSGTSSLGITPDGATAGPGASSEEAAIPAGASCTASAWLYCPTGYATGAHVAVNWFNAAGGFITSAVGSTVALNAGQWAQVTASGTAPGGAARAALVITLNGTPPASAVTYADLALLTLNGEVPYLADVAFDFDPAQVFNDLTVSQFNGVTVTASSATSIAQYGDLTLQETVYLSDPDQVRDLANRVLADYGTPSLRVAQFTVDPAANPAAWKFVLSTDVGTVVQVSRRLQGTQAVIQAPFVIQSVSPGNAPGQWQVRYTATPYFLGALATNDPARGLPNGQNLVAWLRGGLVQYPSGVSQRTWSASVSEPITASLLRQNVTAPLWLVSSPPMAILAQQQTVLTFGSGAYGTVQGWDTEILDTGGGHSDVTNPFRCYIPTTGWWLIKGAIPYAAAVANPQYSFGAAVFTGHAGSSIPYYGGRFAGPASSSGSPVPAVADLLPLNAASPITSGDWFQLQGYQDTGGTINLPVNVGAGVFPWVMARWCGLQSGTAGLPVPSPAAFSDTTEITGAFLNSNLRDTVSFLAYPPMARLSNGGGSQSVASATDTPVTMQSSVVTLVNSDNYGGWSSGTNPTRYTAQRAGRYWCYGQVAYAAMSSGQASAGLRVNGGGTVWRSTRAAPPTTSTQGLITPVETFLRLNAGDYVELIASQSSGSPVNLNTAAPNYSKLILIWRGA